MRNGMLVAFREFRERVLSRSFLLMSFIGPLVVLGLVYALFAFGGQSKQHWNVLIADPAGIMDNKIMPGEDQAVSYSFANGYVKLDEFKGAKKYREFDALLEVNEDVLSNKTGFLFHREDPSVRMQTRIRYQFERRLEEVIVKERTKMSMEQFRIVKQPINVAFRDVNDPLGESSNLEGWAGFFFGALIFAFVFLFGMTILRSISREKSNRIVEVLLASVKPNQLLSGKILGIGLSAFLQFAIWVAIIGTGLYLMREMIFPDVLDASRMNIQELVLDANDASYQEKFFAAREYNEFVNLVYEQMQFGNAIGFFLLFFVGGYLFYGALFSAIGATQGSESDGQQFVIPLILMLCFALYAGYYQVYFPDSSLSTVFHYLPFTSPVVVMVRLFQGYGPGEAYEIYLSFLTLLASAFLMLGLATRLYRNGILQFGHRLKLRHLFKWLKRA